MDQTSASASKPGPSNKNLDPPSINIVESLDVDYGPALPPRLDSHDSRVDDALGQHFSSVEEPLRLPSTLPKKSSHSHRQYTVASSSASGHYSDQSEDSRPVPSRPKKHSDKTQNLGPDMFLLLQRRTSPLKSDIGLLSLQRGLIPIRTILSMTQILLTTGK